MAAVFISPTVFAPNGTPAAQPVQQTNFAFVRVRPTAFVFQNVFNIFFTEGN
jgi:hypothetical protein